MKPIIPFEPVRQEIIPTGDQWIYQIKWDGVRILAYADGNGIALYNRKLHERTEHYPELHDISSYSRTNCFILDGEIIALAEDGKPSFHEVMRRDGLRRMERVDQVKKHVPVYYMVFDILYHNGSWVHQRPLHERLKLLGDMLLPNPVVQQVTPQTDGHALFELMKQQRMEGIVCKRLDSGYEIAGKNANWVKVKNYGDIIAAIGGFTLSGNIVNAVLLGLYDKEGRFWYIGHTGTGRLSKPEWRELTEKLKPHVIRESPFANKPERHHNVYWVLPTLCAKIMYTEWRLQEGRSLRQPSIQAFVEKPARECVFPMDM
ncbi:Multifunctional non-homologous end joining protein LigD [Paenibacillus allorhizosphaerae]|uniref:DNA ligase (ATP) n=1 Tax=Paenibacillus allorhizosphaerae TaxID=2849866 RepID=A0ABM8VAI9_9BACL|nr:Multifunctional non-homologous end joining protein LigD [Paenibacillus allorhizosphaerae]